MVKMFDSSTALDRWDTMSRCTLYCRHFSVSWRHEGGFVTLDPGFVKAHRSAAVFVYVAAATLFGAVLELAPCLATSLFPPIVCPLGSVLRFSSAVFDSKRAVSSCSGYGHRCG